MFIGVVEGNMFRNPPKYAKKTRKNNENHSNLYIYIIIYIYGFSLMLFLKVLKPLQ